MDIVTFYQQIGGFPPNPLQQAAWQAYQNAQGRPALLVKAGTGTGKTEAILFPALADQTPPRRIIMVLPSKALIEDMGQRLSVFGKRISENGRNLAITIDMGGSCRRYAYWNGVVTENTYHRHLFADDIIITTLDKFLFRVFGYGEPIKSFIFPHRIFGQAVAKKPFIIFDEAHEYDELAFSNFLKLLEALFIKGQSVAVMSATIPQQFVDFLDVIDATDGELGVQQRSFQSLPHPEKYLRLVPSGESKIATLAAEVEKRYTPSQRIIVRTETIKGLKALSERLQHLNPYVYHGHMTTEQRRCVIEALLARQKSDQGFLIVATSAIEAGCDFDAHLIVTELCNPDSLVQLTGRLNRRGTIPDAQLVIVGDKIQRHVNVLNSEQLQHYLQELQFMNDRFSPQRLEPLFLPPKKDWMGEILFDMLWDYVYDADLTSEPLWKRGILVTRSWEPAVTVCTGLDQYNRPQNPIQVGIRALTRKISKPAEELKGEQVSEWLSVSSHDNVWKWHAEIKRSYYRNAGNPEESSWTLEPLPEKFPLSCYETTLLCVIHPDYVSQYYDATFGYVELPRLFMSSYRDGFHQFLDYQPQVNPKTGCFAMDGKFIKRSGRVWYLER